MYSTLFFDLDGTLVDSGLGITRCAQYALRKMGIDVEVLDSLRPFVGPPLEDSFIDFYGMSHAEAQQAVEAYRERYFSKGIYEQTPYPGVFEFMHEVKRKGYRTAITTSKIERMAKLVINDLFPQFAPYIDYIFARDEDGHRHTKADVIRHGLSVCGITDTNEVLMIGDRKYDIIGAKECGLDSCGILHGYGNVDEFEKAGATYICESYSDLIKIL